MASFTVAPEIVSFDVTENGNTFSVETQVVDFDLSVANVTYNIAAPTTQITAAENLGGHRVVTVEGYYASKDRANDKFKVLGVTTGAVNSGETATVTTYGEMTESSWNWASGTPVFLSTNGLMTQTAPTTGFRTIIGIPLTSTSMFVNISEPIVII